MAMNRSIKKVSQLNQSISKEKIKIMNTGLGQMMKRSKTFGSTFAEQKKKKGLNDKDLNRLMDKNKQVRSISDNLEMLSRYENLMRQRELKSFIKTSV